MDNTDPLLNLRFPQKFEVVLVAEMLLSQRSLR